MVTAETAVVLPVLLLVLAGAVAALAVVGAQLRCVDAAREGARAAARGSAAAEVRRIVTATAPDGAGVTTVHDGNLVVVTVSARVTPLGPVPLSTTVTASATAAVEPGVGGPGAAGPGG
ncbi:pilus assembly protein [Geodermatophilus sp. YIM 151500]|uniref:TadE family type IV pilus minor pilin n=1 Tax=Geodermatophilus sp. YIM 151500 TaxID=2984531 RepID=UPI0021E4E3E8|nr:TadE family type IV pilus minor pilin [Geodermatophilus sp. YIM 151500]MCV2491754.1 pilus assembly protein [Geodermatophilus sp. YIM 151500]